MIEIAHYIVKNTDYEVVIIKLTRSDTEFYEVPKGVKVIQPVCRYDIRENIIDVSGVANPNIVPSVRPSSTANASLNTSTTRNATATTRNVLNSLINNTEVSENDVYDMLNLLLDPSSNYVSLRFDIVD